MSTRISHSTRNTRTPGSLKVRAAAGGRWLASAAGALLALGGSAGAQSLPTASFTVDPPAVGQADQFQTTITLDASASAPATQGATLRYEWDVPGAVFVGGTDETSEVARVQVPGGWHHPVTLTLTEAGGETVTAHDAIDVVGKPLALEGHARAWHPFELWIEGPASDEAAQAPNPFLDYRLTVTFRSPSGELFNMPGFFDGDGVGGPSGNVWKVRFAPTEGGRWSYSVGFREGTNVAVSTARNAGTPLAMDGLRGQLLVRFRDPEAEGFRKWGVLEHVGEHYLKFRDGPFFLKGGTDSPENYLGYAGFDGIQDNGNLGIIHHYATHAADWREGDPYFVNTATGVDSKGIIGSLNYLSSKGVNSVYFLPMNLGGDGQETCPFLGYTNTTFDKTHYDLSRMAQWSAVFQHAQSKGILLHFVLAETEPANEQWLDGGAFGIERRLFFREMIARFGSCLALKWNLCEENDFTVSQLRDMAAYIQLLDPYDHPLGVHTHPNQFADYEELVGDANFTATSIQYDPNLAGEHVEAWRAQSAATGHKWVVDMDENNPYWEGLRDDNADYLRKKVLYDVYFSGGQVEWYAGYHGLPLGGDVTLEDFRTREDMWNYMRFAREFMEEHLPFWEMEGADHLLTGETGTWDFGSGEVFAKAGEVYAVYLARAQDTGELDLSATSGAFQARWFNPRTGQFVGAATTVQGGTVHDLPSAPAEETEDWVYLLTR